ncbi:MAG: APC family permease [Chloroflexota bacterium]|nr:APC family permease [Chloroflexota bacterium]MDQ5865302.1 APC family permease [Chloroflexota bacterium]
MGDAIDKGGETNDTEQQKTPQDRPPGENGATGAGQQVPDAPVPAEGSPNGLNGGETGRRHQRRIVGMSPEPGSAVPVIAPRENTEPPTTNAASTAPVVLREPGNRTNEADQHYLRQEERVKGSHPGDQIIKYSRTSGPFKRTRGMLVASLETEAPRTPLGRAFAGIKRVFIGKPLSTEAAIHERLTNVKALAILSSDPLSSVAYATEEILRILIVAGTGALWVAMPVVLAITVLMMIVVSSYRQTIAAYPRGGGTYIVAKDNLGTLAGLTAASSILIGYILTVAVSVAAGVAAIYSLYPELREHRVPICIGIIIFVTLANLRGVREAGNIFAVPTYLFIVGMLGMIVYGLLRLFFEIGGPMVYEATGPEALPASTAESLGLVLLLRAFTQGSAALTGVEAIADGVPAFKPPEAANARKTLLLMAAIAITMFIGITFLAVQLQIIPNEHETVVSQLARTVFGTGGLWFFIQIATALILVLAANTAYADFPRLSYFMARDKFMPHQYSFRGDRLAFSWGIVTLAVLASVLVVVYNGDTSSLIPLYAVGVFGAFTMSQSGMVVRWWKTRPPGWKRNFLMNLVGAATTLTVLAVAVGTKLDRGTWIVAILIPLMIGMFMAINRHYARVSREVAAVEAVPYTAYKHTFIVPVSSLNQVSLAALAYARSLNKNVTAVHIVEGEDTEEAERFREEWERLLPDTDINLVIIESPYRSLVGPLLHYIDARDRQIPDDTITIVLPEVLPARFWEYLLHNQSALRLKAALLFRSNTVVADMPYILGNKYGGVRRSRLASIPWGAIMALVILLGALYLLFFPR